MHPFHLGAVTHLDSAGAALIAGFVVHSHGPVGRRLTIECPSAAAMSALELIRLTPLVRVVR